MNVGIMVSSQTPEVGGGYTFEDDILQALFRLRGKSGHDFFLVGHAPERPGHLDHTGLPWMSLHQPRELRRKRRFSRLLQRLKLVRKKGKTLDYEDYPGLKKQGLDLMCYLTPMNRPIADIPYITTVWDLMHRLTPFFPELCLRGEWESRDLSACRLYPRSQ